MILQKKHKLSIMQLKRNTTYKKKEILMNETEEEQYALEMQLRQAEEAKMALEDEEILNLLSPEQQMSIINTIIENTNYQEVVDFVDSHKIAESITFRNCNEIAYLLYNKDSETAKALFHELKYWLR